MTTTLTLRKVGHGLHPRHALVVGVAAVVEIGLRTTRVPRLARVLRVRLATESQPGPSVGFADPEVIQTARRYARATDRVLRRWPFGDTCLRRSLVVGFLIRRFEPTLLIGVRRDEDGEIAAHAWLVVEGTTLDPGADQYLAFGDGWDD